MRNQGRLNESIEVYRTWVQRFPKSEKLRVNAINCAIEINSPKEALKWIEEYERKRNTTVLLKHAKARAIRVLGDTNIARVLFEELLDKKEIREEALLELGTIEYEEGNLDKAIRIFETAKKECSNSDGRAISNLITIYREKKETKKALLLYTECSEETKRLHIVMAAYAYTLLAIEDTKGAIDIYMKLIKQSPLKSIYWLNLCACYRVEKKTETAIKVAKTGMIFNPGNKLLKQTLAQSYAEIGKDQQVRKLIKDDLDDENISDQHMYNLQFLGEGYKLLASDALKKMAQKWEQKITK